MIISVKCLLNIQAICSTPRAEVWSPFGELDTVAASCHVIFWEWIVSQCRQKDMHFLKLWLNWESAIVRNTPENKLSGSVIFLGSILVEVAEPAHLEGASNSLWDAEDIVCLRKSVWLSFADILLNCAFVYKNSKVHRCLSIKMLSV